MNYYNYKFATIESDNGIFVFDMNTNKEAFKYFLMEFRNNYYERNQIAVDNLKTIIGKARTEKIMKYIKYFYGGLLKLKEDYTRETDENIYYGFVFGLRD